jgi:hypothetical protein
MYRRAFLSIAAALIGFGKRPCAPLLAQQPVSEKSRLLDALRKLGVDIVRLRGLSLENDRLIEQSWESLSWFMNKADSWTPATPDEGRGLRESIERMTVALLNTPADTKRRATIIRLIADDLADKREFCRTEGLSARRQVKVVTKRGAIEEVKGLEVLYLEKFFESAANAKPLQFRGFSSPAVDDLVPGRYLFWAKEPGPSGKSGERKEARITVESPADHLEVLAP